jgi:hypothetical protein
MPTSPRPADIKCTVLGTIRDSAKAAVADLIVRAYDQDLRNRQLLGESKSGANGAYEINYTLSQANQAESLSADLVIVAFSARDEALATSSVLFNAPFRAQIDLVVDLTPPVVLSEYESVLAQVTPLLDGQSVDLSQLEESTAHRDLSFISQETGLAVALIAALASSARLVVAVTSAASGVVPTTAPQLLRKVMSASPRPAAAGELSQAFYGLIRQGLRADLSAICATDPEVLRATLKDALRLKIVPATLGELLDQTLAAIQAAKAALLLMPSPSGARSISDLLEAALPPDARAAVAAVFAASGLTPGALQSFGGSASLAAVEAAGNVQAFWNKLAAANVAADQIAKLRAAVGFDQATGGHQPLIAALVRATDTAATHGPSDPRSRRLVEAPRPAGRSIQS